MNAIVLMVIGPRYEALYEGSKLQFEVYAKKCGANLEICRRAPDPNMHGHILTQKMLLPKSYSQYKWIAFLDLDVIISKNAPNIFNCVDETKGFGAVLDPLDKVEYLQANRVWFNKDFSRITTLTNRFTNEGFKFNSKIIGIINSGVWVAKPSVVSEIFSTYYFGGAYQGKEMTSLEEIPMSYLTQNADLFFPLNVKFNNQLIYFSCEKNARFNYLLIRTQEKINQLLKRFIPKRKNFLFLPPYIALIEKTLDSSFILHFSGGYPIPQKLKNSLSFDLRK
ncbi:hypothetical protein [Polynucleobacter sp. JS-JIR-5-A7]|uniref:hypothetical protein n=1 Tax=Polynucleobacter sp. JS-JIR-5-A7 TaxID=1758395 RepID=UPI001BFEA417|nr:hypothetical protein [Polynucleobacter sp. JS-JIR-5-A7]QWE06924.1 hypothetical protein AOC29_01600 [Polynucleobacter sp. JS-JIR-5-A7]